MPGFVFYEGPSRIDGQFIVGIATYNTRNEKTGDLVQTWILRGDIAPSIATKTGEDFSVCGNCPLRGIIDREAKLNVGRTCYVLEYQAPNQVYRAYLEGKYPKLNNSAKAVLSGKGLRYGSYGDPVAIPRKAWRVLEKYCTGKTRTGYTHQWRLGKFSFWAKRLMASTHSIEENQQAQSLGWRTFRTMKAISDITGNEIICPASAEKGFIRSCENCGACNGRRNLQDKRYSIAIVVHGKRKDNINNVI